MAPDAVLRFICFTFFVRYLVTSYLMIMKLVLNETFYVELLLYLMLEVLLLT